MKDEVQILTLQDPRYPQRLKEIYDPPPILYIKGNVEILSAPSIALVGARSASEYGLSVCERLAGGLARLGITVVSGLARGIDAAAHRGAVRAQGPTAAVLGHGLGQIYPPENSQLAHQILASGGALVTEFEHAVGVSPEHFPRRNRIISGLSLGVVVVEARKRSGSLITARLGVEEGREIFAVPGPVTSARSEGTHRLIQDGAKLVRGIEDILEEIPALKGRLESGKTDEAPAQALEGPEARIHSLLNDEPKHVDRLIVDSTLPAHEVIQGLMNLSIKHLAQELPGRRYVRGGRDL